ncbi:hypothetical protein VP01_855g1 [Puccinia sorghi]|uniref:Uncharacterized protein n=1 Tax=Puccinia sorghi TaxID=27349 RepID=A0A0L6U900_9BASI|nr:hypothetical protein VP01_855g1 [Puccinia sorghi]
MMRYSLLQGLISQHRLNSHCEDFRMTLLKHLNMQTADPIESQKYGVCLQQDFLKQFLNLMNEFIDHMGFRILNYKNHNKYLRLPLTKVEDMEEFIHFLQLILLILCRAECQFQHAIKNLSAMGLLRYQLGLMIHSGLATCTLSQIIIPPQQLLSESNSGQPTEFASKHSQIKHKSLLSFSLTYLYYLVSKATSSLSSLWYLQVCSDFTPLRLYLMISSFLPVWPLKIIHICSLLIFHVLPRLSSSHSMFKWMVDFSNQFLKCMGLYKNDVLPHQGGTTKKRTQFNLKHPSGCNYLIVILHSCTFSVKKTHPSLKKIPMTSPPHADTNLTNYHSCTAFLTQKPGCSAPIVPPPLPFKDDGEKDHG